MCVEACPSKVLALAPHLNPYGYHPVTYRARAARDAASDSLLVRNPARSSCRGFERRHPLRRPEPRDGPSVEESGRAMPKELIKGNEAIVKAAILDGFRAFYGYPITPASEIAEPAALYMPQAGGVFVQAESEVAAINMIYGAAAAGVRSMTASSRPGLSLMQEGLCCLAGSELPCVALDRRHVVGRILHPASIFRCARVQEPFRSPHPWLSGQPRREASHHRHSAASIYQTNGGSPQLPL